MENTKTGYHFGTQLRVGPLGRRLCALRERSRLVSTTIRFDVAIILPPLPSACADKNAFAIVHQAI